MHPLFWSYDAETCSFFEALQDLLAQLLPGQRILDRNLRKGT